MAREHLHREGVRVYACKDNCESETRLMMLERKLAQALKRAAAAEEQLTRLKRNPNFPDDEREP
jgi:hypothetical protein